MIGFIVPFRAKSTSNDWGYHSALLKRTLLSILAQIENAFKVYVVYTDMPAIEISHKHLTFIHFPFPYLQANEISDFDSYPSKHHNKQHIQNSMDQGRRILYGCREAIKSGCRFIMSVDADDLVSNRIASYININSDHVAGWYINKGYVHLEDRKYMYRHTKWMNHINGSTNIIRSDLIPIPNFNSHALMDYNFFSAHAWLKDRIKTMYNVDLLPLPFYAVLYCINRGSWMFGQSNYEGFFIKKLAKLLLKGQLMNGRICEEFSFYSITK